MKEFSGMVLHLFEEMRTTAFQHGYVAGVTVSVVTLILLVLLYFLCRTKVRSKGILLAVQNGTLFISASAIADLVREVEKNFSCLKILKCTLLEKKKNYALELKINFPKEDSFSLPAAAESLQMQIMDALKNSFGIESIREINIEVIRGKALSGENSR